MIVKRSTSPSAAWIRPTSGEPNKTMRPGGSTSLLPAHPTCRAVNTRRATSEAPMRNAGIDPKTLCDRARLRTISSHIVVNGRDQNAGCLDNEDAPEELVRADLSVSKADGAPRAIARYPSAKDGG
jgi:hypothetical protein